MNLPQAIVAYEGRPAAVVDSVLIKVASSGTQGNYAYHNFDLVLWVYEMEEWREEFLRDWMVERLISAKEKGNKETRATCKAALEEVNRSNYNCPIVIEKLKLNVFSHCMSTKKSKKSRGYLSATSYGGV